MKLVRKYISYGATGGAITAASLIFLSEFLGSVLTLRSTPTVEMAFLAAVSETFNRIVQFDAGFVEIAGKGVAAGLVVGLGMEFAHLAANTFFGAKQKVTVGVKVESSNEMQPL